MPDAIASISKEKLFRIRKIPLHDTVIGSAKKIHELISVLRLFHSLEQFLQLLFGYRSAFLATQLFRHAERLVCIIPPFKAYEVPEVRVLNFPRPVRIEIVFENPEVELVRIERRTRAEIDEK